MFLGLCVIYGSVNTSVARYLPVSGGTHKWYEEVFNLSDEFIVNLGISLVGIA